MGWQIDGLVLEQGGDNDGRFRLFKNLPHNELVRKGLEGYLDLTRREPKTRRTADQKDGPGKEASIEDGDSDFVELCEMRFLHEIEIV